MSDAKRMLKLNEVCEKVGLQKTAIYDLIHKGDPKFPGPIKFGSASRWIEGEVDQWIDECASRQRKAG